MSQSNTLATIPQERHLAPISFGVRFCKNENILMHYSMLQYFIYLISVFGFLVYCAKKNVFIDFLCLYNSTSLYAVFRIWIAFHSGFMGL